MNDTDIQEQMQKYKSKRRPDFAMLSGDENKYRVFEWYPNINRIGIWQHGYKVMPVIFYKITDCKLLWFANR